MLEFLLSLAELLNGVGALRRVVNDAGAELCVRGLCAEHDKESEYWEKQFARFHGVSYSEAPGFDRRGLWVVAG
jgi:hypothetical protein